MRIALDATYSIGEELSGVGLYSREILFGMAVAHPEAQFDFYYRPHRYFRSWRERLPANVRRRMSPGSADLFHGLNQRLPEGRLRRAVSTFHDLFVLTGAGILETTDAGANWSRPIAAPKGLKGIGGLTWMEYDPTSDSLYVMKMGSELYKLARGK